MDAFCLEANDPLINIPDHDEKSLCHNSCHIIAVLFCQASSIVRRNRPLSSTKCFTSKVYKPFQSTGCLSSTLFFERENFSALQIFPWQSSDFSFPNRTTLFPKTSEHHLCIAPEILKWQSVFLYNLIGQICLKLKLRSAFVPT